jgi:hypothetical protein
MFNCHLVCTLVACCSLFSSLQAQSRLVLMRKDRVLYQFIPGDPISVKLRTGSAKTGTISGVYLDYLTLTKRDTIFINQIQKVDVRDLPFKTFHVAGVGTKLIVAGSLLFIADRASASNEGGDATGVTIASVGLIGSGLIMQFYNNSYFRVGRRNRLGVRKH